MSSSASHRNMQPLPTDENFCSGCKGFMIGTAGKTFKTMENCRQVHRDLASLKLCAENGSPVPCPLCRLLWASYRIQNSASDIEKFLRNWNYRYVLAIHDRNEGKDYLGLEERRVLCVGRAIPQALYDLRDCSILEVFAKESTSAASQIQGRVSEINSLTGQPGASDDLAYQINWIRKQLGSCSSGHPRCGGSEPRGLPLRLVDISNPTRYRVIETQKGDTGRYVALSYAWGEKINNQSVHKVRLEKKKLGAMKKELDQRHMTRSHLEGIKVARQLGYQYIWIDALCIFQGDDSNSDWEEQAHRVPDIYGHAELTILAGRSYDSRIGFLDLKKWYEPSAPPIELPYATNMAPRKQQFSICGVGLPRNMETGPANQRAWCFQEYILSRRVVTFGDQQLMWKCRDNIRFEDGGKKSSLGREAIWYDIAMLSRQSKYANMRFLVTEWHRLIEIYATKGIYDPFDCYAALAGVARRFESALASTNGGVKPRYLAGIWETSDMIYSLLWRSKRVDALVGESFDALRRPRKTKGTSTPQIVERAPSWSWMAVDGPISVPEFSTTDLVERTCCFPASDQGYWAPGNWGVDKILSEDVQKSLPFRLHVKGRIRRVFKDLSPNFLKEFDFKFEIQNVPMQGYNRTTTVRGAHKLPIHVENNLRKYGVWLSDDEITLKPGYQRHIALGLFDVDNSITGELWILPMLEQSTIFASLHVATHGLLLSKKSSGAFSRVGLFWITKPDVFMNRREQDIYLE